MENFKSFGGKLVVPLLPGFTAITGPNGSGKSNITDAILFVLGPRSSKEIRAGKLTDLIFNGGKKRKNPAKYCKVSLIFDNSDRKMPIDTDEVKLTRLVKRAPVKGNKDNYYSYFYINGKPASFNDFTNLLTYARISGEKYNLVKQGDITSIIETSSIERRKIIDDIAGISNFDADIEKAEREREQVEDNIKRINIILGEINKQINSLKKDRDEAFRYKELQEELYSLKSKIAVKKKLDIKAQISEIQKQIETYEKEKKRLEEKREEIANKYKKIKDELTKIEEKVTTTDGEESSKIKKDIESLRTEIVKIEEKINYSKAEITDLSEEKKELENTLQKLLNNISKIKKNRSDILKNIESTEKNLGEKEKELTEIKDIISNSDKNTLELSRELATLRDKYNEMQNKLHSLNLEKDRLEKNLESIDTQIAELEESKRTYEFELKDIEWQVNEIRKEKKDVKTKKEKLEKELFDKKRKEAELAEQFKDLENILRGLQREYAHLKAECEAIESIEKGYNAAVREILAARDSRELRGVHGTVAELAKVDKKYEVAIRVAGGQRLQAIIVDNDDVAAQAIAYLKRKKIGRATFLPLNKMISGKPRGKALLAVRDEKALGFAIDLIDFKKEYYNAFWYVFGDTVIVEDLDTARKLMGGVRLVDLDGDLIESTGAITGGRIDKKNMSPLFSNFDRSKLDELSNKIREVVNSLDLTNDELTRIREEIRKIEEDLKKFNSLAEDPGKFEDLEIRRKEFEGKLTVINKKLGDINRERKEEKQKLIEIEREIEKCIEEISELNRLKEEKARLLFKFTGKELADKAKELEEEVLTSKEKLMKLNSEKETINRQIEMLDERKKELEEKIKKTMETMEEHRKNIKNLKKEYEKNKEKVETLLRAESQISSKIQEYTRKRDELYKKSITYENELDKIATRIESYVDLISRANYRLPTLETALKELEEETKRYGHHIDEKEDLPDLDVLNEKVKLTEENMKELEPVNMRALEEYDHQVKRKEKLEEDVKHLKEQKKKLINLVKEITKKKRDRFYEVFEEINNNFKEIYSRLSEGGEAELTLENPEDPFSAGLTIKAKPRGKKILNLNALSGGEKTIASLALIFALQNYDPSPFYVLDEVDMFLDSINAEAVSRMIKENSNHAQFIVVTLRRPTLKEADHVYGVTLREDGVSQMIGNIDLESIKEKIGATPTP
ncbi:chromosome segregation protein SMC [Euryarchaeota archaeon ex4484_162]|nr:MAG: chromosome segregation protein SMC [Euryarchaeota archaeon ex4484_162]